MDKALQKEVASFETQLQTIFDFVKQDQHFHDHVLEEYKRNKNHYHSLENCYQNTIKFYDDHVVHRYSGDFGKGYHISVESINFEKKLWYFAENNPEQWYLLIEKIAYSDHSANIFTLDGFSFMDNFIHNGIYDDWNLGMAKKTNEILFFNIEDDKLKQKYVHEGYTIEYLNEKTMDCLLLEMTANKSTVTKSVKII